MEDIIKFRIFLSFPLLGLLIPDLGLYLTGSSASISMPITHLIIVTTLLICIAVLTVGISVYKKKHGIEKSATPVFDL
ncbi:hypothetical protein IM792_07120 [Mucilaginibacter sp. JRF]|uniref:hypothetical protein n=1 Tax=Mucilaginibacter sp. JRF TaxID=2780088 RepID=UPI0018818781|nr:hypothetical protein [Mucilaginibacter sp. JRF]MBE9584214.1 hypothetical protein [Mucilaginibacter sp. JRF]